MPSSDTHTTKPPSPSVVVEGGVDLDRLARAVARHETASCTKGYGVTHNNCHGIKSGKTYPCKFGKNKMCIFSSKEESFTAFKVIWKNVYGGTLPTIKQAERYSGHHNAQAWHKNVLQFYKNVK